MLEVSYIYDIEGKVGRREGEREKEREREREQREGVE
jgi:hypothetical protein